MPVNYPIRYSYPPRVGDHHGNQTVVQITQDPYTGNYSVEYNDGETVTYNPPNKGGSRRRNRRKTKRVSVKSRRYSRRSN